MRALLVNEIVASEAPERPTFSKKRHEAGRAKNSENELEKCVYGRAGRAPRCMRALLVNEIVASEAPERSMLLICVPVKHESNTPASEIEPPIVENQHQRNRKSMKSSLSLAQKHTFSKKVLRQRSGVSLATISTHTSRATAARARLFKLLVKNLAPEPLLRQKCWKT